MGRPNADIKVEGVAGRGVGGGNVEPGLDDLASSGRDVPLWCSVVTRWLVHVLHVVAAQSRMSLWRASTKPWHLHLRACLPLLFKGVLQRLPSALRCWQVLFVGQTGSRSLSRSMVRKWASGMGLQVVSCGVGCKKAPAPVPPLLWKSQALSSVRRASTSFLCFFAACLVSKLCIFWTRCSIGESQFTGVPLQAPRSTAKALACWSWVVTVGHLLVNVAQEWTPRVAAISLSLSLSLSSPLLLKKSP